MVQMVLLVLVILITCECTNGKKGDLDANDPIQLRQYFPYNAGFWLGSILRPRPIQDRTTSPSIVLSRPNTGSICKCGDRKKRETRIVGGTPTKPHQYPEMVLVLYNRRQMCGGTILNNQYVLTAAHCVAENTDITKYQIIIGAHNIDEIETSRKSVSAKKAVYHPDFNTRDYRHDIAILELTEPLKFDSNVQPTCVPTQVRSYSGQDGTAVGWGRTSETGPSSQVLREVTVPIISNRDCQSQYYRQYEIFDSMICAGTQEGGKDSCAGDSGGPLFVSRDEFPHVQVGITSFGSGCARPSKPGVYARVDEHIDFLMKNIVLDDCKLYSDDEE